MGQRYLLGQPGSEGICFLKNLIGGVLCSDLTRHKLELCSFSVS